MNLDEKQPWDKLPDETPRAFAAFSVYLSLGPARSIAKAFAGSKHRQNTGKTAVAPRHWEQWAAKFDWQRRAQDYDLYLELQARQQRESEHNAELEAFRSRQRTSGIAAQELTLRTYSLIKGKLDQIVNDWERWIEEYSRAETEPERQALREREPVTFERLPALMRAAAFVGQAGGDAEAQAIGVNELLHILEDGKAPI